MFSLLLAIIYLSFISLGLPGFAARLGLADDVSAARRSGVLFRNRFYDHFSGYDHFQSAE